MSSTAIILTPSRPLKRARVEVVTPKARFEKGDYALVRRNGEGHENLGNLVIEITEGTFVDQRRIWQYGGRILGTEMHLTAPDSELLKPEFRLGDKVRYYKDGAWSLGKIVSIETGNTGGISYGITPDTLIIAEGMVSKV